MKVRAIREVREDTNDLMINDYDRMAAVARCASLKYNRWREAFSSISWKEQRFLARDVIMEKKRPNYKTKSTMYYPRPGPYQTDTP